MTTTIWFEQVSKKYYLGLTRTSLPTIISQRVRRALKRMPQQSAAEKTLWALKDVTFELKQGQSLALIGPNGAGKTTILKLLARITKPTLGTIETNGRLSALIELGAGFHPDLTGRENIYLNGTILGLKREQIKRHFDEIVDFSGLERFIDTPVKRYSSGMNVRLGFAVAACIESDILLVDEVLAVGDAMFRQKCITRIEELVARGSSIVFISHNLWLVQSVCKSAIYLEKGQVKFMGDTSEAISLYDQALSEERAQKYEGEQLEPVENSPDVELTKIEILAPGGASDEKLLNDQVAKVQVHYLAHRAFGNINIVVRILRSDGLTCCMMRSNLDDVQVSLDRGRGIVSVVLDPLQLRGGTYYVQAMFRDGSDAAGIAMTNSDWFYVAGSTLTFNEMNGVFEPRRIWDHVQLPLEENDETSAENRLIELTG